MRKLVTCVLVMVLLMSFMSNISHANSNGEEVKDYFRQEFFYPLKIDEGEGLMSSGGLWEAQIKYVWYMIPFHYRGSSDSYMEDDTRWPIDKIGVRVRAYLGGYLYNSKSDSQTNSSIASVSVNREGMGFTHEAVSNHTFEMTGFQSWYPELWY